MISYEMDLSMGNISIFPHTTHFMGSSKWGVKSDLPLFYYISSMMKEKVILFSGVAG